MQEPMHLMGVRLLSATPYQKIVQLGSCAIVSGRQFGWAWRVDSCSKLSITVGQSMRSTLNAKRHTQEVAETLTSVSIARCLVFI